MSGSRIMTVEQLAGILEEREVICVMEENELIATITKDPVHGITSTSNADVMEREVKSLSASLHGNIVVVI